MEFLIGIIIGIVIIMILKDKPLRVEVKHIRKNEIVQVPYDDVASLKDDANKDADKVYEEMSATLDTLDEIMKGGK